MANITETLLTDIRHQNGDLLKETSGGDLRTISGLDNMKEHILRRIMTVPGSIIHRPNYGVGLQQYMGATNNIENQRKIAKHIEEQLLEDSRIAAVKSVGFRTSETNAAQVYISVKVELIGYGETMVENILFGEG